MKKFYIKAGLLCALLASSVFSHAVERPKIPVQKLTDGGKYVVFNYANPTGYLSRTSWDGAYYFLGKDDSKYESHAWTAKSNSDGTWSFYIVNKAEDAESEDVIYYVGIPGGTDNLNCKEETSVSWTVEDGDYSGYYKLKAGEGNNYNCMNLYLHLNSGGQYFVISEPVNGGGWYPDFYGGALTDEEGNEIQDEEGNAIMADKSSQNWAFVNVDDVSIYGALMQAYSAIDNVEKNYLTQEGYEAGFQNGLDAAMAIYTQAEFLEEDADAISEMLNAKIALYEEIEKAKAMNETGDAALTNAITTATNIFNTSAKAEDLKNATSTLAQAETNYQLGSGDMTSLGQNMSFEDLSAQDGSMTTQVGNVPAGWNMYINGVGVNTIDEIKANGLNGWCGVNDDCSGDGIKDGNYAFGVWNQSIPEFELSQTITGLENGTYTVSAGLMVGANGSGSRRTTQRIFGNLNSTYWASRDMYDEERLDNSEVYGFANLIEDVTDKELQLITVKAYVYDGTLTFGFRTNGDVAAALRSSSNSAGGDGWFKIDNFRILKDGYNGEDAAAVASHYLDILTDYDQESGIRMESGIRSSLAAVLAKYPSITAETAQAEINAAIIDLKANMEVIRKSVKEYQTLGDAIDAAWGYLEEYADREGAEEYQEVIQNVQDKWEEGSYDADGIENAIKELEDALDACKKSGVATGKDVTELIANPSFEDQSNQGGSDTGGLANPPKGWTLKVNSNVCTAVKDFTGTGIDTWCAINSGDAINVELEDGTIVTQQPTDGSKLWGIWSSNIPEVELSQTLTGIPSGTYILTADVMVQHNWAGNNITSQRIFGNGYVQMFASEALYTDETLPADALKAKRETPDNATEENRKLTFAGYTCEDEPTTNLLHPMSVTFGVDESGVAQIGFRTNGVNPEGKTFADGGVNGQGWFKVDNFTLYYASADIPTAIKGVETGEKSATVVSRQYFTIDGVQIAAPQKGINIVKSTMSDGSVKVLKTIIK